MRRRCGRLRITMATLVVAATLALTSTASPAAADAIGDIEIEITRSGDKASINATRRQTTTIDGRLGGVPTAATSGLKGRKVTNRAPAVPVRQPTCTNEIGGFDFALAAPPPPELVDPYLVVQVCKLDGVVVSQGGVFWLDRAAAAAAAAAGAPPPAPTPAVTDIDIRRYVDDFLVPDLVVRHNPDGTSLTGVETWFWVEGWDGAPVIETVDVLGFPVLVELRLAAVEWDFGDGSQAQATDLGRAYPDKTGTTHVYTARSTVDSEDAAFTATATVTIEVEVSIGGSPLVALQPFTQTEAVPIIVREAQALLE